VFAAEGAVYERLALLQGHEISELYGAVEYKVRIDCDGG